MYQFVYYNYKYIIDYYLPFLIVYIYNIIFNLYIYIYIYTPPAFSKMAMVLVAMCLTPEKKCQKLGQGSAEC